MQIGLLGLVRAIPLPTLLDQIRQAERAGFATVWLPHIFEHDALTVLALPGQRTSAIALGAAVIPTYPRHPAVLAQQALTVQAATGNRLVLGIGPSHQVVIEQMMGLRYAHPIRHMREYLNALTALLSGQPTNVTGELYDIHMHLRVPEAMPPPILIAALRPHMLQLAGQLAGGTITWLAGPRYLETTVIPLITDAAVAAGRPAPRIVAGFPVAVTDKPEAARTAASRTFATYATLPAYRAALDGEGVSDAGDVALVGTETDLEAQFAQLAAIGVTDLAAVLYDIPDDPAARERTYQFLAGRASASRSR
jgi:5,10-methylenetetrahydromethanopterin reductase